MIYLRLLFCLNTLSIFTFHDHLASNKVVICLFVLIITYLCIYLCFSLYLWFYCYLFFIYWKLFSILIGIWICSRSHVCWTATNYYGNFKDLVPLVLHLFWWTRALLLQTLRLIIIVDNHVSKQLLKNDFFFFFYT